ncbi:MAG: hypothetical protein A3C35_01050 [Omnitrophica bacterium RIFCSPHIGHO2_02_FULL_46_11]|nr:MAG: hypothetical protein A3C35_01050 [Omnitrophica bacterium RIFCSPHIGHO2_02_FULL_46_11]OGW87256.1 MAG: hypothetical protein A3A81_03760 [Omnitrophica bacterium RIFCSPLOWO2_01_FULL_45_10b]
MYYVYVLKSLKTNRYYIGSTKDIDRRLKEHQSGFSRYTKSRGPWELIYKEEKVTLNEAEKREQFFKTGDGRRVLKKILGQLAS